MQINVGPHIDAARKKFVPLLNQAMECVVEINYQEWEYSQQVRFNIDFPSGQNRNIAMFSFTGFPANDGILISHDMWIQDRFRGRGLSHILQELKEFIARKLNANLLLATVNISNVREEAVLRKNGWTPSFIIGRHLRSRLWAKQVGGNNEHTR